MQRVLRQSGCLRAASALLLIAALIAVAPPARAAESGRNLLVMGDSLSAAFGIDTEESWVALLGERLQAKGYGYAVVNASITGDTTGGGLKRLPRALALHKPAVVIIELGGNDGLRGTPIPVIRDNLARMIELSREAGAEVVLTGLQIPTNYGGSYTRDFAKVYVDLARRYQVGLVEFFLEGIALDEKFFQPDGIHPTAEAQPILLENLWPVLEKKLHRPASPRPASLGSSWGRALGAYLIEAMDGTSQK